MGKYDALADRLRSADAVHVTMSFDEIATIVEHLPQSAARHRGWWSNEDDGCHAQARAWLGAGYRAQADLPRSVVTFHRSTDSIPKVQSGILSRTS